MVKKRNLERSSLFRFIEKERMYVENASRAMGGGFITVDNL